jgi:hypothetical protein
MRRISELAQPASNQAMQRTMRALVVGMLAIAVCAARGDTPLPPPSKVTVTSPNGRIRAVSDPKATITRVEDTKLHKVLWLLPDWYRSLFVANDGKHLVTEYDGLNLLPTDFRDDLVLLTFWREGKKLREVTVRDLFPDHSILQRTASHYAWRETIGIDEHGRLKMQRVDGKIFFFDVATGKETKT